LKIFTTIIYVSYVIFIHITSMYIHIMYINVHIHGGLNPRLHGNAPRFSPPKPFKIFNKIKKKTQIYYLWHETILKIQTLTWNFFSKLIQMKTLSWNLFNNLFTKIIISYNYAIWRVQFFFEIPCCEYYKNLQILFV